MKRLGDWSVRRLVTVVVLASLAAGLVTAVVRADGYRAPQFDLHDAGIWVAKAQDKAIGRLNTELLLIDSWTAAGGESRDLLQSGSIVLLHEDKPAKLRFLDVRTGRPDAGADVPVGALVRLGGTTAALLDPAGGRLWIAPGDKISTQSFSGSPSAELKGALDVAVGLDGVVHVLVAADKSREVVRFKPDGERMDRKSVDPRVEAAAVTAVGATSVVLDPNTGTVTVPGGKVVSAPLGKGIVLQEPGPPAADVVVAGDRELERVPLAGGGPTTLWADGGGRAVAPVRLGTCVWGAWQDGPAQVRVCEGAAPQGGPITGLTVPKGGLTLRLRVNRNRVVLNELALGVVLIVDDSDVKRIDDWSQALANDLEDDGTVDPKAPLSKRSSSRSQQGTNNPGNLPPLTENKPPEPKDDTATTRERRPVVVNVLNNDTDPNGDVLVVDSVDALPADVGIASVIGGGTAVQFTPALGRTSTASFRYTVDDGRGGSARATLTVSIHPRDVNGAPVANADEASVEVGRSVTANVLANDRDPDGDALALTNATAPQGSVQFNPDGTVVFTAPGAEAASVVVTYQITDELGLTSAALGQLTVSVLPRANVKPVANNDHVTTLVREPVTVNVLTNDSDVNGDPLVLVHVDHPPDLDVRTSPQGLMRIVGEKVGSYSIDYDVTDGPTVSSAVVRVDILESAAERPPVAVRDDVFVRVGVRTRLDVLGNDYDPDGDVIILERVEAGLAEKGLAVEVVDQKYLEVLADAPLAVATSFTYTITDGPLSREAVGTVVVRSVGGGVNQPPVTARDELSIRAGNSTAIRVLANDSDPDGDDLTLAGVSAIAPGDGDLFVEGNQLRYTAPPVEKGAVLSRYKAMDSAGNKADGELVIHVLPADTSNSAPVPVRLEARVIAGREVTIRIPLVGIDPEGDPVTFLGTFDPPMLGSIVETGPASLVYRAAPESAGTDRFSYRVRDALMAEATGTIVVGVMPVPLSNTNPVAVPDKASVRAGGSVRVDLLANDSDPDGDPIELLPEELGTPSRGSVKPTNDGVVFTAPAGVGEYETSFNYTIADSRGATARSVATVKVTDDPTAKPPIARDDVVAPQLAGATVVVDVLENDEDPDGEVDKLRLSVESPGVTVADRKLRFTMADAPMTFSYAITDPQDLSARALVQVSLAQADLPPVAGADTAMTDFGKPVRIAVLSNDKDPEGKALTLTRIVGPARKGSAEIDGDVVVFSPETDFAGEGGFVYEVSDGKNTAQGSVVVSVGARENRPPVFTSLTLEVAAGDKRDVDLSKSASDPDTGDKLTFSNARSDTAGIGASLSGTTLTVTAAPNLKGSAGMVTVGVSDGKPKGDTVGSINVRVLANAKPLPSAVDDTARTFQEKPVTVDVLVNDTDPAGVGLRIGSVTPGVGGTPELQGDKVLFTPSAGFFGQASFTYTAFDKTGEPERKDDASVNISVIGRPSAPPAPTAVAKNKSVDLQWAVPSANGAPIDKYEVQTEAGAAQNCVFSSETACSIGGLTNGSVYRFQVRAHNEAGNSPWSASSPDVKPDVKPSVPGAPTSTYGDSKLTVALPAPANEGTAITQYVLEISPPPSGAPQATLQGAPASYVWTGLPNGTAYRFRFNATNGAGTTDFGPYGNPETPSGPPFRMATPTVAGGDTQVTVSWTEPNQNGAPILDYELQLVKGGSVERTDSITDPATRSKVVTGLTNGSAYTFVMRAHNKAGWSDPSPAGGPVTPAGPPLKVGTISATEGDTNSQLSFADPSTNGSPITGYRYRISGGSDQILASSKLVGALTNGQNYTFQVRACNAVGCGDPSDASNTVNPYGVPGQPGVSGGPSGTTINWNWTTPASNGRAISRYDVYLDGSLVYQGLNTSYSRGFGYSETHTLNVQAVNLRGAGPQGSASYRTVDKPRTVDLSNSGQAALRYQAPCENAVCTYINVSISGFAPNTTYQIDCRGELSAGGNWCTSAGAWNISTDGNGNGSAAHKYYYGFCRDLWVYVGGVESNHVHWTCT